MSKDEEKKDSLLQDSLKDLIEKYRRSNAALEIQKSASNEQVFSLPLASLSLFPLYDEFSYSEAELADLLKDLSSQGQKIPLFLWKKGNSTYVINGVKRFLALKRLNSGSIKGIYIDAEEEDIIAYCLDNLEQGKANGMTKSYAYKVLIDDYGFKEKEICEMTGLSHGQINNQLRLVRLPNQIKTMIISGSLSSAKARLLVTLPRKLQLEMALRFKGLSVRECEELAREQHEEPNDENEEEMTYHIEGQKITVETKDEEQMKEIIDFLQERGKEC